MNDRWPAGRATLTLVRHLCNFLEALSTWCLIFPLGARKDPTMSGCSLTQATNFCSRRAWRSSMITLCVCGSMLTSVVFERGHIFLGSGSLVLNGLDTLSGCIDPDVTRL